MTFSIHQHFLEQDGKPVARVLSPYTSGVFKVEQPSLLVIHYTGGGPARSSAEWFRSPQNTARTSAHLVIDRNGDVIQCVPLNGIAHHAGRGQWRGWRDLNRRSFGLELANWGPLSRTAAGWVTRTGISIPNPVLATHRHGNPDGTRNPVGWEPYPPVQVNTAVAVAQALIRQYGPLEIVGHDDIAPGRKSDPGPAFDMARFRQLVTVSTSA